MRFVDALRIYIVWKTGEDVTDMEFCYMMMRIHTVEVGYGLLTKYGASILMSLVEWIDNELLWVWKWED